MSVSRSRKLNLCSRHGIFSKSPGTTVPGDSISDFENIPQHSSTFDDLLRPSTTLRSNIFEVSGDGRPRRFNLELRKSSTTFFDLRRPSTTLFDLPEKCPWPFICIYPKNVHQPWSLALNVSQWVRPGRVRKQLIRMGCQIRQAATNAGAVRPCFRMG